MAAKKSKDTETKPSQENVDTSKIAESTNTPEDQSTGATTVSGEATTPAKVKKKGFTVSSPNRPNDTAEAQFVDAPVAFDKAEYRFVNVNHPVPGPGMPRFVEARISIKTGEVTYAPNVQARLDRANAAKEAK
jgi:hypothetical protein